MSNPTTFINNYVTNISNLVDAIEQARILNDMIAQDSTLVTRYFSSQGARTDIVAADVTNAQNALVQLLFTFDSGSPTQKSYLFKMLP